jgi:Na+/melibiose symporter-like transporter
MAADNRLDSQSAEHDARLTSSSSHSSTTVAPVENGSAQSNSQPAPAAATRTDATQSDKPAATAQQTGKPAEPEAQRTPLQTSLIMLSLCSALFLAALDVTIVTVAVPSITEEFNSPTGYTWIGSAYLLASSAGAPIWGKISDIWGRKPILLIAVAIFWVGSVLSATSVNMSMLIAARAIQGIGGGGIVILVNITVSDLFSMRKRGLYFGILGM